MGVLALVRPLMQRHGSGQSNQLLEGECRSTAELLCGHRGEAYGFTKKRRRRMVKGVPLKCSLQDYGGNRFERLPQA
jgi:hypothetical protein